MRSFLAKLFRLAAPYRGRLGLGLVCGILAGLMETLLLATILLVYSIVFQDATTLASTQIWKKLPDGIREWITEMTQAGAGSGGVSPLIVTLIPAVFLIRGVVSYLNVYLLSWVSIRAITDLRTRLFSHLISMPATFFSGSRSGELMSRVLADTELLRNSIANSIATLIRDPVTLISMLAFLFWTEPRLTALSFVVLPVCIVPISIYARKGRKAAVGVQTGIAELSERMMESFTGNRIVKAYNLEKAVTAQFQESAARFVSNYMRVVRATETPGPLLELAGSVGVALLLAYAVKRTGGDIDGTAFIALVGGIVTMYRPMKAVVRLHSTLEQARAASERVFHLLEIKTTVPDPAHPKKLDARGADITFSNVSFSYEEKPVLREINLKVSAGKLIALVGASGSGKTTLTNLLLRFYDPTSGAVRIGDVDVREVSSRDLRDQIAIVTQETILFNDTIRNNIAVGRPGATEDEIVEAAKHAHAHEFIVAKPEGYETVVGERGVALSGGQRQRLAIARAIVKDAPILILDEATNALDAESERIVQSALEQLMVGRTTICIAHRLSTIQRADMIVVMADGRIVETGTHDELLSREGVYRNLHNMQFNTAR